MSVSGDHNTLAGCVFCGGGGKSCWKNAKPSPERSTCRRVDHRLNSVNANCMFRIYFASLLFARFACSRGERICVWLGCASPMNSLPFLPLLPRANFQLNINKIYFRSFLSSVCQFIASDWLTQCVRECARLRLEPARLWIFSSFLFLLRKMNFWFWIRTKGLMKWWEIVHNCGARATEREEHNVLSGGTKNMASLNGKCIHRGQRCVHDSLQRISLTDASDEEANEKRTSSSIHGTRSMASKCTNAFRLRLRAPSERNAVTNFSIYS